MPYPGLGNSYDGWYVFSLAGTGTTVGANNYSDVTLTVPEVPELYHGTVQYILAQAPSVQAATPQLMISYVWLIDATHIGVRWMNTTGGNVTLPAAIYSVMLFA